jgi:hypothetical protein
MRSFKLEKGGNAKNQAISAGAFLFILGVPVAVLVMLPVGAVMMTVGLLAIVGGKFASN